MVRCITVTGRIVDYDRELTAKALEQLRDFARREGCAILLSKQVPKPEPVFLDIDYAALERRVLGLDR